MVEGARLATEFLKPHQTFQDRLSLHQFHGWYDLIITAASDPSFKYRLVGDVESGKDSISDPALGGLALQG